MTELLVRPSATDTAGAPDGEAPSCEEFDEAMVCIDVQQVTHDVKSFVLAPDRPRRFVFDPGQHLTVHAGIDGRTVERCYTIASSPLRSETLTITVKRVADGPVSSWLHDRVRPGDRIAVSGPLGTFTTARRPAERYLFLSAGSGITPLMSMLRAIRDRDEPTDVVFVHNARTPDDIVFRGELRRIATACPNVRVVPVCEDDSPRERWSGHRGRMARSLVEAVAPDLALREVFTCGPPAYMAVVRAILAEAGAQPDRCHEESFVLGGSAGPETASRVAVSTPERTGGFDVTFRRSGRTVACEAGSTVLEAAARAGLTLPSSCAEGVCGTCKTTLLSGSVDMDHQGGIRPREIAQNKILLCCSTPQEDLVVDA